MVSQPQLKRPEFKDLAVKRRKSRRRAVAGYHWGLPNVGTIQKDGNGYALRACRRVITVAQLQSQGNSGYWQPHLEVEAGRSSLSASPPPKADKKQIILGSPLCADFVL